jgi:Rod binding domain-containing protein
MMAPIRSGVIAPATTQSQSPALLEMGPGPISDPLAGVARRADGTVDPAAAAKKFEAVLASMLLSEMRRASGVELFGSSAGAQVFEGMFDQMLGDAITAGPGFGLARGVEDSIRRLERSAAER